MSLVPTASLRLAKVRLGFCCCNSLALATMFEKAPSGRTAWRWNSRSKSRLVGGIIPRIDQTRMKTIMRNFQRWLRFMEKDQELDELDSAPDFSVISVTADFKTSSFESADRSVTLLSLTLITMPTMPLEVTTRSLDLRFLSKESCCLARTR